MQRFLYFFMSLFLLAVVHCFGTFFFSEISKLFFFYKNTLTLAEPVLVNNITFLKTQQSLLQDPTIDFFNVNQFATLDWFEFNNVFFFDINSFTFFNWIFSFVRSNAAESLYFFDFIWNSANKPSRIDLSAENGVFDSYDNFLLHFSQFFPKYVKNTSLIAWRFFAEMYCIDNLFTFDVLFVLFETFFYHTIYLAPSLYFDIATRISLFLYFYFFIFFIVAVIATTTQQYLGIKGLLRLFLCVLGGLLIAILFSFILITRSGASFFLEYKIYSIYIPTVVSSLAFTLDYLSASFMFLVTAIGIAAVAYARVYLYGDPHTPDFLVKLVWFVLSMLSLVISKNFILFYFSWEFIGITSMWLINFNAQRTDTFKSAIKAFTFNKISDLCLFCALLIGFSVFKTSTITLWNLDLLNLNYIVNNAPYSIFLFNFLLLIAASIKSAQLGFHLWLPDSMDAPVPASALIHSATLVSAGVYILLRFYDILQFSGFMPAVALLGACTAAYGGVVAGMQTDLKRALAYSTISHCGFLFLTTALGGSSAALLYLFLHGFFKALSFICAGDYIRLSAGYQDLNRMGGFYFFTPSLSSQFLIAMGNLCGLPFFLGYFFKNNFQTLFLTNSYMGCLTNFFVILGLLSSLLYFFKVFYCVVFSYKKTNYKTIQDFYTFNNLNFQFPLKTPKALYIIFWFIYLISFLCIFWYFQHTEAMLTCSITDVQTTVLTSNTVPSSAAPATLYGNVNYFFIFYSLFCGLLIAILLTYECRRSGWPSLLNKITLILFFIYFTYIII